MKASTKARLFGYGSLSPEELAEVRAIAARSRARRRDKKRAYDAVYYAANRQGIIRRAVAWRSDRRREFAYKVNQVAARHGVEGKLDWRDLVPGPCHYCGTPCESWDHMVPMSRGGANTLGNLVPACWPCNSAKKARTVEEWLGHQPSALRS